MLVEPGSYDFELSGYDSKVWSVAASNQAFANDISLITLTPLCLQMMLNIVYSYCQQWLVAINVGKPSVICSPKENANNQLPM